jgi:hypothetical protein
MVINTIVQNDTLVTGGQLVAPFVLSSGKIVRLTPGNTVGVRVSSSNNTNQWQILGGTLTIIELNSK